MAAGTLRGARARCAGVAVVMLFGALSVRCQLGLECDPEAVVQRLAGPGAMDCGSSDGWEQTYLDDIRAARACIASAIAEARPFFATVSPASSDGGVVIGFAGDGASVFRIEYDYTIAMGCVGGDKESMHQARCEALLDAGEACDSLGDDLCLECQGATPFESACR